MNGFRAYAPDLNAQGAAGFRPESFEILAEHQHKSFWYRGRNSLIRWAVGKFAPHFRSALEIGCGTGYVLGAMTRWFPEARHFGSEIFTAGLAYAAARAPAATLFQMDARHLGFVEEFDLVGAYDVLEHIEEDEQVLSQIHAALVPNGVLFATVPQHPWLWSDKDTYTCHVRRYMRGELERKLASAGFRLVYSSSFVTFLLPVMLVSRLKLGKAKDTYTPKSELSLPRIIDSAFAAIMGLERGLMALGLRLPIGGSRLVVAVKDASTASPNSTAGGV